MYGSKLHYYGGTTGHIHRQLIEKRLWVVIRYRYTSAAGMLKADFYVIPDDHGSAAEVHLFQSLAPTLMDEVNHAKVGYSSTQRSSMYAWCPLVRIGSD